MFEWLLYCNFPFFPVVISVLLTCSINQLKPRFRNVIAGTHQNAKAGYLVLYGERQLVCVLSFLMLLWDISLIASQY